MQPAPLLAVLLAYALLLQPNGLTAEQVRVRHKEGLLHGFLALRTLEGKKLADGEMTQVTEGDRLTESCRKIVFEKLTVNLIHGVKIFCIGKKHTRP